MKISSLQSQNSSAVSCPAVPPEAEFLDAAAAVAKLQELYKISTEFLRESFTTAAKGGESDTRYRAYYPELVVKSTSHAQLDSRLAFGYVHAPGIYAATSPDRTFLETT